MKLISLFFALAVPISSLSGSPIPEFPHIFTKGSAEKGVAPDTATVTFTVIDFQAKSEDAVNNVNQTLKTLVDELKKLGVKDDDITANDLEKSVTRERNDDYKDLKILGYTIERSASVKISDLKTYPPIAQLIFKTDLIKDVRSHFGITKIDEITLALFEEACAEARKKADTLAKAAGVTIDRVYAVSPEGVDYFSYNSSRGGGYGLLPMAAGGSGQPDSPLFVPAKIQVDASVTMLFRLTGE